MTEPFGPEEVLRAIDPAAIPYEPMMIGFEAPFSSSTFAPSASL